MKARSGGTRFGRAVTGGLAAGCLFGLGMAAVPAMAQPRVSRSPERAAQPSAPSEPEQTQIASRRAQEVFSVTAVDRPARQVTMEGADGERRTLDVPPEVRGLESVKVGDHVEIEHAESIGISVLPPGTKPSTHERTSGVRSPTPGAMTADRELTVSAEVVGVDPVGGTVSFRDAEGETQTVEVADPELEGRLASLRPGQVLRISYRESIAASIQPAGSRGGRPPAAPTPPPSERQPRPEAEPQGEPEPQRGPEPEPQRGPEPEPQLTPERPLAPPAPGTQAPAR